MPARQNTRRRIGLVLLASLAVIGLVAFLLFSGDLPAPDALIQRSSPDTTKIFDRHGRLLFEVLDPRAGRRTRVALADLPLHFRQAVLAVEDANYYQHPGVHLAGVMRAGWQALNEDRIVSGGSTITQQLARELLLSKEERESRSLSRKLREMILALRINQTFAKDTVFEMYLNEVYFGQLAYGVEAAARTYFGKPAGELDLAESALLAGMIQSPAAYNPLVNLDAAHARQQVVLGLMVKNGFIGEADAALAQAEALHFVADEPYGMATTLARGLLAPHFVVYVRNLLEARYGSEAVNHGGLRVVTTLDYDLQGQAEQIVRSRLADLARRTREGGAPDYNVHDAALVSLDPATGDIMAMVGSADYFDAAIDGAVNVALAQRQPGSSIKPITYATAFAQDYTAATVLSDVPTSFTTKEGEPYQPQNFDQTWHGPISLRQALATSSNMIAVKVLDHVGLQAAITTARALGISTFDHDERFGLSLTLGGGEVTLLELTAAYGGFANGGRRVTPRAILSVSTANGRQMTDAGNPASNDDDMPISPQVAYLITSILSDNNARIPAFGEDNILRLSRPAAAKTGTTTDFRDNWTLGYTPDIVTGVWVGNADSAPMYKVSGITGAGPIWHDFMEAALANHPVRSFERPMGLVDVEICATSGLLATNVCPRQQTETFIAGTEPLRADDSYQTVAIDSASGLLWGDGCQGLRVERVFWVLPPDAQLWGQERGVAQPPEARCNGQVQAHTTSSPGAQEQSLIISSPARFATFALTSQLTADSQRIEIAARNVQANLIPRTTPSLEGYDFGAHWQTALEVSGDFYDFIAGDNTPLGIVIGDVADKGMPAALFMMLTRAIVRASLGYGRSAAESIAYANRLICADAADGMFVTLCYSQLDARRAELTYVNAGHPSPLLYRAACDELSELPGHGTALGISDLLTYEQHSVALEPGDIVILYTDGVPDALNSAGEDFGKDRLLQVICENCRSSSLSVHSALERALNDFMGDAAPADDATFVVLRRK